MSTHPLPREVLLVNPNTNTRTTDLMVGMAFFHLDPRRFRVRGATAASGPSMITTPEQLAEAAPEVLRAVSSARGTWDLSAVVVSAFGDPGRAELAASLDIPVVGIGEASILAAAAEGEPFGVATSTPALVGGIEALVADLGCTESFTGVELTQADPEFLALNPWALYEELRVAVLAGRAKGATTMVIGGGPMVKAARKLRENLDLRIVEPIPAAAARVEALLAQT